MIRKMRYVDPINDPYISDEIVYGTICGANIKPYKIKEKMMKLNRPAWLTRKEKVQIVKWGIFIHIKMDNGDQYDAIWSMTPSYNVTNLGLQSDELYDVKKKSQREKDIEAIRIPTVLRACGVSEWVDLIGTRLQMKRIDGPKTDGAYEIKTGRVTNDYDPRWYYPDYYELHKGGVK